MKKMAKGVFRLSIFWTGEKKDSPSKLRLGFCINSFHLYIFIFSGMFYDATGSYDASFYISGTLILLSGILGMPLRRLAAWEKKRKNSAYGNNNVVISVTTPGDTDNAEPVAV